MQSSSPGSPTWASCEVLKKLVARASLPVDRCAGAASASPFFWNRARPSESQKCDGVGVGVDRTGGEDIAPQKKQERRHDRPDEYCQTTCRTLMRNVDERESHHRENC